MGVLDVDKGVTLDKDTKSRNLNNFVLRWTRFIPLCPVVPLWDHQESCFSDSCSSHSWFFVMSWAHVMHASSHPSFVFSLCVLNTEHNASSSSIPTFHKFKIPLLKYCLVTDNYLTLKKNPIQSTLKPWKFAIPLSNSLSNIKNHLSINDSNPLTTN